MGTQKNPVETGGNEPSIGKKPEVTSADLMAAIMALDKTVCRCIDLVRQSVKELDAVISQTSEIASNALVLDQARDGATKQVGEYMVESKTRSPVLALLDELDEYFGGDTPRDQGHPDHGYGCHCAMNGELKRPLEDYDIF